MQANKLAIVGIGVNSGDVSFNALNLIKTADFVLVRTAQTKSWEFLKEVRSDFISLDFVYEKSRSFNTLNKNLAKSVLDYLKKGSVCYLVDGGVSDDLSSQILIDKHKNTVVFEGVSKCKNALSACGVFSTSYSSFSAYDIESFSPDVFPLVVFDLDSKIIAGEWKLKLMETVGEEQEVWLYSDKQRKKVAIYQLDWEDDFDYSTVLIVEKTPLLKKEKFNFSDLYEIVKKLRAPDGCPWDRAQNMDTIRKNLIEECYELCDAIDQKNDDKILEEIGDVLLQAVFHIIFAEERFAFNKTDAITDECKKLIFRHSHIFGEDRATNSTEALDVWDKNKQVEKGFSTPYEYVSDVPKSFPSLLRGQKVLKRCEKYAISKPTKDEIIQKISQLAKSENKTDLENLLLCCCYLLKILDMDGEESLYFAISRLVDAFSENGGNNFNLSAYLLGEKWK